MSDGFQKYIEYINNTGGNPEISWFDCDWAPAGPLIRQDMKEAGLIVESGGKIALAEVNRDE